MALEFDESDFVDRDFLSSQKASVAAPATSPGPERGAVAGRPPTREELDAQVMETQQRLTELKQTQERLERERAALEEARRRRVELQTGRSEMLQHLTRGIGLLEEAEFAARRDAEQMNKTLGGFRDALQKLQTIHEETWTQESWQTELTRALTTIENARMEWNAARLKWALLGDTKTPGAPSAGPQSSPMDWLREWSTAELCRLGLALTWPLAVVTLLAVLAFVGAWFRK